MNKNPPSEQRTMRILTFFLPRKHWLRLLANEILNGNIPEEYDFQQLLDTVKEKGLFNPRPAIASWALGELQLSEVQESEATIALTLNSPEELRRNKGDFYRSLFIVCPFYFILMIMPWYLKKPIFHLQPGNPIFALLYFSILKICSFIPTLKIKYSRESILKMERPEGIGSIASHWLSLLAWDHTFHEDRKNTICKQFFKHTVCKVDTQHLGELGRRAMPRLCKLLQMLNRLDSTDAEQLMLSLLHALQLAGDGSVIPTLESLTKNGRSDAVKSAAAEALPVIRERADQLYKSDMLLRPSSDGQNQASLLRAASSPGAVNPETLLRPGSPEPEGVKLYENQEEAQALENRAQS